MSSHRALATLFSPSARLCLAGVLAAAVGAHLWAAGQRPLVRFDGCTAVRRLDGQTTCITKPQTDIVLWAENTSCDELLFTESGAAVDVPTKLVNGGCQARVPVGQGSAISRLEVLSAKSGDVLLGLQLDRSHPNLLVRSARMKVRAVPDLREVDDDYRSKLRESNNTEERLDLTHAHAIAYQRMGLSDSAMKDYTQLVELAEGAGFVSISISAQVDRAQILAASGQIAAAKSLLEKAYSSAQLTPGLSAAAIDLQYAVTIQLESESQPAMVLEALRRAHSVSEGLANSEILSLATMRMVGVFTDLRRFDEALKILPTMNAFLTGASDCERAKILANQAIVGMNLAESGDSVSNPLLIGGQLIQDVLDDALKSRNRCLSIPSLIRIYVSRARLALLENRLIDAKEAIDAGRALPDLAGMNYQLLSMIDYEAQWALRTGHPQEALRLFAELEAKSGAIADEFPVRAAIGKLEVLQAMNKTDAAAHQFIKQWIQTGDEHPPALLGNISRRWKAVIR